jgi:hypothetical protein
MPLFLDVRVDSVGGPLATSVNLFQGTDIASYSTASRNDVLTAIRGRNVLVGTHGFNVDRASGIDCLNAWSQLLLELDSRFDVFVGLLWPGDSVWAHGLDYPDEPKIADAAGELLAPFLDALLAEAASISFSSHSLGARVVLRSVLQMNTRVRRVILMAGAIDDDCLTGEFQSAAAKIGEISVLSSQRDEVLALAFPLGNLLSGIFDVGHPWWHAALGRNGPQKPWPQNFRAPFQIPTGWGYGHHNYLQVNPGAVGAVAQETDVPPNCDPIPTNGGVGWAQTFSAAFAATRFKE